MTIPERSSDDPLYAVLRSPRLVQLRERRFTGDQTRFPAPDLIVEVLSPSTEQLDRTIKFEDYAAHGVTEYWLIEPEAEIVEQGRES